MEKGEKGEIRFVDEPAVKKKNEYSTNIKKKNQTSFLQKMKFFYCTLSLRPLGLRFLLLFAG